MKYTRLLKHVRRKKKEDEIKSYLGHLYDERSRWIKCFN